MTIRSETDLGEWVNWNKLKASGTVQTDHFMSREFGHSTVADFRLPAPASYEVGENESH